MTMKNKRRSRLSDLFATLVVAILLIVVGCSTDQSGVLPTALESAKSTPTPTSTPALTPPPKPADRWFELFQRTPYPYTTPLPPPIRTILDDTYTKFEPKEGTPVPCRRCPDYAPEGGIWKLSLDKGIFRIFYTVTGWRSMGSFTVSGDRIVLFNDPNCIEIIGIYTWTLKEGALTLKVIDDTCAIRLRAKNLTSLPWASCQPPSRKAAISDHWPKPPGCD